METSTIINRETDTKGVKKDNKGAGAGIRISLPELVAEKLQNILKILKERGSEAKADDVLSSLFLSVDDEYLNEQLEALTPASYYLELAKDHPQLLAQLIQQAKRGMQQIERGEEFRTPKKPGRKPKNTGVANGNA